MSQIVAEMPAPAQLQHQPETPIAHVGWVPDLVSQVSNGALVTAVLAFALVPSGLLFAATPDPVFLTFFLLRDGGAAWRWATQMLSGWRRPEGRMPQAAGAAGVAGRLHDRDWESSRPSARRPSS